VQTLAAAGIGDLVVVLDECHEIVCRETQRRRAAPLVLPFGTLFAIDLSGLAEPWLPRPMASVTQPTSRSGAVPLVL
jgi:hypothetical protein